MSKKIKLLITFIMAILMIMLFRSDVFGYSVGQSVSVSVEDMCNSSSGPSYYYCVDWDQKMPRQFETRIGFTIVASVEINGRQATFSNGATRECSENAVMAAIVGGGVQLGHGALTADGGDVSFYGAQRAVFGYWNKWVSAIGGQEFLQGSTNDAFAQKDATRVNQNIAAAEQAASQRDYSVVIYFLVCQDAAGGWQNLIIVEPKNIITNEYNGYIVISGTVWEDGAAGKSNEINGTYDSGESGIAGVEVSLKHPSYTFKGITTATTNSSGKYELTINYIDDNAHNYPYHLEDEWDKVDGYLKDGQAYLEFKYNGYTYTTVQYDFSGTNTSKATEDENSRNRVDAGSSTTAIATTNISSLASREGTVNKIVSWCLGNGYYDYTNQTDGPNNSHLVVRGGWHDVEKCTLHETSGYHGSASVFNDKHLITPGLDYYHTIRSEDVPHNCGSSTITEHLKERITCSDEMGLCTNVIEGGAPCGQCIISETYYYTCKHIYDTNNCASEHPGYSCTNIEAFHDHDECVYCVDVGYQHTLETKNITCLYYDNVNLGLFRREHPDAALASDIEKVRVVKDGQEYIYEYGGREITGVDFDYQVKFGSKYNAQKYSRPLNPSDIAEVYANKSDDLKVYVTYNIKAKNESNTLTMEINTIVNYFDADYSLYKAGEYHSSTSPGWTVSTKNGKEEIVTVNGKKYKVAYCTMLDGTKLDSENRLSDIVKIEFEVSTEAIYGLLNEKATLNNVSEIYSYSTFYGLNTLCAEEQTAKDKYGEDKIKNGVLYAGKDIDSTPGNAKPNNTTDDFKYEDDTDKAPSFLLHQDQDTDAETQYKILSGNIWEDLDANTEDNERLGDGIKKDSEKGIQNVKVELLEVDENGEPVLAKLYRILKEDKDNDGYNDVESVDAVTYTDSNGDFAFGNNNDEDKTMRIGIPVGNYVIRYTYGNDDKGKGYQSGFVNATADESTKQEIKATTIDGSTEVNARNYKSTIITNYIEEVIQGTNESGTKWHLDMNPNETVSVAVDDLKQRMNIPDLKYGTYDDKINMSAYTKPVEIQVEYTKNQTQTMVPDANGNIDGTLYYTNANKTETSTFDKSLSVFDFGIIERPKEDLVISKTISKIKVVLANEQKIIDGNPSANQNIDYTKALGFAGQNASDINSRDKLLTIELDSEITQGARIEVWYEITVQNNSEIDYEYKADYTDITKQNPITTNSRASYYYYGKLKDKDHPLISSTVELVADYMTRELDCKVGNESEPIIGEKEFDNAEWYRYDISTTDIIDPTADETSAKAITAEVLLNKGYISNATAEALENYQILVTDTFKNILPGQSKTSTLYASKLLANKDQDSENNSNTFDNHVEILQINSRIARTIDSVDDNTREQIGKQYKPGNYIPDAARVKAESTGVSYTVNGQNNYYVVDGSEETAGLHHQDDDRVRIVITPPTGATNYVTPNYTIAIIAGLIVIIAGIIFIKKKVIKK